MDEMKISALQVNAVIGCLPREKKYRQRLFLDIALWLDLSRPSRTDLLEHTVDYTEIETKAGEIAAARGFTLVEALAGAVLDMIMRDYPQVKKAAVTVFKPGASARSEVRITVGRER